MVQGARVKLILSASEPSPPPPLSPDPRCFPHHTSPAPTVLTVTVDVVVAGVPSAILVCVLLVFIPLGSAVVARISPLVAVRIALVWVSYQRAVVLGDRTG